MKRLAFVVLAVLLLIPAGIMAAANRSHPYIGLKGTGNASISRGRSTCADFGCKSYDVAVGDISTKTIYRCNSCGDKLKDIPKTNLKCFMTPSLAKRLGYHEQGCTIPRKTR